MKEYKHIINYPKKNNDNTDIFTLPCEIDVCVCVCV